MRIPRALLIGLALLGASLLAQPAWSQDPAFKANGLVLPGQSAAAPTSAAPPASSSGAQITQAQLTTQVAFGRPIDTVTRLTPTQTTVHAWFAYTGATPGTQVTGRVVLLAPAGEIEARTAAATMTKPADSGSLSFSVGPDPWPEGRYRVDLILPGLPPRSLSFEVAR
ncbi:MAG TPA: hypothetical protein VEU07_01065 [Candidatus Acidoferrum sp.]|nr:hypothetical protein [Candidatus Acidoferrum sp.]